MERMNLTAEVRAETGKGVARSLRRKEVIPCVIYRHGQSVPIQINRKELVGFVNASYGQQLLVNLNFSDGTTKLALMKDHQVDHIKGELLHTDFYEVSLQETVRLSVAVLLVGTAVGVKRDGGILQAGLREIEIECLPDAIPAHVELDVTGIEIGHSLHVSDLNVDTSIKVLTDTGELLATVLSTAQLASEQAAGEGAEASKEPEVIKKGKVEDKTK
ncbi:MAG: 50S ribosomal protein L25 [Nitrospirae bacterium]|uniref:50S ribosomal protein L25 n=1 Tax=Candidatus Magnetobacterium casense TaxID=1455061 RepID=UPI00069768E9|nr:50S ribosomal protein L25 [Candidatus Magnetobacterium casensis]MBF0338554.1 50S ribosomal protein L25 [Nitrospirota bacterium]